MNVETLIPNSPLILYENSVNSITSKLEGKEGIYFREEKSRYGYPFSNRSDVEKIILPIYLGQKIYRRTFDVSKDKYFMEGDQLRLSRIKLEDKNFDSDESHENLIFYYLSKEGSFFYGSLLDTSDKSKILSVGKGKVFSKKPFRNNINNYLLGEIKDNKRINLEDLNLFERPKITPVLNDVGKFMLGIYDLDFFLTFL